MSRSKKAMIGRVMAYVVSILLIFSGIMKIAQPAPIVDMFEAFGLAGLAVLVGMIEVISAIVFLIRPAVVYGAVLLTGFMGGAVVAHMGAGQWASISAPAVMIVLVWVSVCLRKPDVFEMPIR